MAEYRWTNPSILDRNPAQAAQESSRAFEPRCRTIHFKTLRGSDNLTARAAIGTRIHACAEWLLPWSRVFPSRKARWTGSSEPKSDLPNLCRRPENGPTASARPQPAANNRQFALRLRSKRYKLPFVDHAGRFHRSLHRFIRAHDDSERNHRLKLNQV